ncbi:Nup85 nucleoporin-domain-containing protein [Pisolithus marmoratus]|nr:Nup85 nucleoporin-domain-containing protein [Pisolithus marmoratus]
MQSTPHLDVLPPLVEAGKSDELVESGRTLLTAVSPLNDSYGVFPALLLEKLATRSKSTHSDERNVYFVSSKPPPSTERRLESIQRSIRKLALDYVNFAKECWIHTSRMSGETNQATADHYRSLYTCLSLFTILYLPEYGLENAPVGDDLMEWLNIHFIEPSTEEGDHLSSLERPWEDETFWPYLTRAILRGLSKAVTFFLGTLSEHPSGNLRRLAQSIIPLLSTQPKLQHFDAERDFAYASHRWKEKVKMLRIELDDVPESDRRDSFEDWWDRFSDIVGILEGREEVIRKVCEELGADWREVCVAWGVFVDTRLRRQDLPDVAAQVLEDMPPDPTILEDMVHVALFMGDPLKALEHAAHLDPWLSAHLADMMEPLSLVEQAVNDETELSVRDFSVLSYAHYLHSDPAMWRITVSYMYSCGKVGAATADEILVRVPLRLQSKPSNANDGGDSQGDLSAVVKDVNATCREYQREAARRVVCKIAAQTFVQRREYGLAISYCSSAEDWPGLGRVIDRVLREYIHSGPEQYTKFISGIAPSLQGLRVNSAAHGVFIHRLMFAVRYAEFHQRLLNRDLQDAAWDLVSMLQEGIAPKAWWAVLLCDAIELLQYDPTPLFSYASACVLLRRLDEIISRTAQGAGEDYLKILEAKRQADGQKDIQKQLQLVRFALAKYFARCAMIGTGGTQMVPRKMDQTV